MRSQTVAGLWWIPGHDDHAVAGKLTYSFDDFPQLELIGDQLEKLEQERYPILLGALQSGGEATLWDCKRTNSSFASPSGYRGSQWNASFAFIGRHFEKEEDIILEQMTVRLSNLELWLDMTDIPDTVTWSQSRPLTEPIRFDDDFIARSRDAEFTFWHSFQPGGRNTDSAVINRVVGVSIRPDHPLGFQEFLRKYVSPTRDFITFALGQPSRPIELYARSTKGISRSLSGKDFGPSFRVFYSDVAEGNPAEAAMHRHEPFFLYSDVQDQMPQVFREWMNLYDRMESVLNLYFALQYRQTQMYSDSRFLMMAQMMEAYHRSMFAERGRYMPQTEYRPNFEKLKSAVCELDVSEDLKASLVERLKYGNEVNLRTRLCFVLDEVLDPYSAIVDQIVPDRKDFIARVVKTRNYLTHIGSPDSPKVMKGGLELYRATVKLSLLMRLCICCELKFSLELVTRLFTKNYRYSQLLE